mgnify:CR=1 FL=1
MYILNGFSSNMLVAGKRATVKFRPITAAEAAVMAADCESAVGHADTARIFSKILAVGVKAERKLVTLTPGSRALLGGYRGPRLPEGATELPEGAGIDWYEVSVE